MRAFLVGGPQLALGYFQEFGNAIAYWNYLTLGEGVTELQNLGIDPEEIQMYELKFMEDLNPELILHVDQANEHTRERTANDVQKSFDEVSNGVGEKQGDNPEVLVETTPNSRTITSINSGRNVRHVENEIKHDSRTDNRKIDKKHKASGSTREKDSGLHGNGS